MKKIKLRTPTISFDKAKRALWLVALAVGLEFVDPLPFFKTPIALMLWFVLFLEIVKQFITYRMEISIPAVMRAEAYKKTWERQQDKIDPNVRYRIRRFVTITVGLYVYGWVISLFTDRCEGGFGCALLTLNLIVENTPEILTRMLYISFGFLQLGLMMVALTRVGFVKIILPGTIDVIFDDIYGQDKAKARVVEQIDLLENDEAITKAGGYMPKGMMLTGPPGTGKTMLAKAAANRSSKPLILIPPGAFVSTFMGINFLKVWQLGKYIRKYSKRHGAVIVFFDEIDVLGSRGGVEGVSDWFVERALGCANLFEPEEVINPIINIGGSGNDGTLQSFLSMMEGMEMPRGLINKLLALVGFKPLPPPIVRVFYLAATNRPQAVDPALKRAGRFGREIRVDFPDYEGRLHTYEGYLNRVTHALIRSDIEWFARNHYHGTGAEIEDIVNEAILITFRDKDHVGIIHEQDMMNAMLWKRFGESRGTFENKRNIWGVAVHEASHALVMHKLLSERTGIWFVSIEQRGKTGGMVARSPKDDDWKEWHFEMLGSIAVSLASRVGEKLILKQMTNGHGGDGRNATANAEKMVLMGHGTQLSYSDSRDDEEFHREREDILQQAYDLAEDVLIESKEALIALARLLQEKHTLTGQEVEELLEQYE